MPLGYKQPVTLSLKRTFDFAEIPSNCELKRETVCGIYFLLFSELMHTILEIFSHHDLHLL